MWYFLKRKNSRFGLSTFSKKPNWSMNSHLHQIGSLTFKKMSSWPLNFEKMTNLIPKLLSHKNWCFQVSKNNQVRWINLINLSKVEGPTSFFLFWKFKNWVEVTESLRTNLNFLKVQGSTRCKCNFRDQFAFFRDQKMNFLKCLVSHKMSYCYRWPGFLKLKLQRRRGPSSAFIDFKVSQVHLLLMTTMLKGGVIIVQGFFEQDEESASVALSNLQGTLLHSSTEGMHLEYPCIYFVIWLLIHSFLLYILWKMLFGLKLEWILLFLYHTHVALIQVLDMQNQGWAHASMTDGRSKLNWLLVVAKLSIICCNLN